MEIQVRLQRRKKAAVHKQEQEYGAAVALDIAVEAGMPDMVPDTAAVAVAVMVVWIVAVMAVDTQSDVAGREMSRYSSEQLFLAMIAYSCHQKLIILHMRISANNQDQTMPPPPTLTSQPCLSARLQQVHVLYLCLHIMLLFSPVVTGLQIHRMSDKILLICSNQLIATGINHTIDLALQVIHVFENGLNQMNQHLKECWQLFFQGIV